MEVGSAHLNFKLSIMLNLKDVQPRHPNQNMLAQKRKHDNILKVYLNGVRTLNDKLEDNFFNPRIASGKLD
jgi:hypothetical protein